MNDAGSIVDTGDARIFVREQGTGNPLLLVHGLGMSSELWAHQMPAFAARFRTIAVDLRGFGQSSKPDHAGAYTIETLAKDMAAVIAQLDISGCHFLGTSMGGFIGQALALAHPESCGTLVLCHTAPRVSIPADILAARVEALGCMPLEQYAGIVVEQALAPHAGPELRAWLTDMIVNNDKRAYAQVLTEGLRDFDAGDRLGTIQQRTLVITGELDQVLPPEGGREIAALIPNARHVELPEVGHLGYAENPSAFNDAVMSFLG